MKSFLVMIYGLLLSGCAAPGTPILRTSTADGEGPLISGCQNVSKAERVDNYITTFYLTTWGSVWMEGTVQQVIAGFSNPELASRMVTRETRKPASSGNRVFNQLPFSPVPFCRIYTTEALKVSEVVSSIMPLFGNSVLVSDQENGVFETNFLERQHAAARWLDSYSILVFEASKGSTIVEVLRNVYISRDGRIFNQGVSVGHNEAWILTQIDDRL